MLVGGKVAISNAWKGSLSSSFVELAGHFHTAESIDVFRDAVIQGFGNPLAVFAGFQAMLVAWVRHEGNLSQNRWHIRANQHDKRRLLHAAVSDPGTFRRQPAVQRLLHVSGELPGLFNLFL